MSHLHELTVVLRGARAVWQTSFQFWLPTKGAERGSCRGSLCPQAPPPPALAIARPATAGAKCAHSFYRVCLYNFASDCQSVCVTERRPLAKMPPVSTLLYRRHQGRPRYGAVTVASSYCSLRMIYFSEARNVASKTIEVFCDLTSLKEESGWEGNRT